MLRAVFAFATRRLLALLVAVALAGAALATVALAGPTRASRAQTPVSEQAYLALAQQGVIQANAWQSTAKGTPWYCEQLGCPGQYPLLTIWGVVRLIETRDAVQIVSPSRAHKTAVDLLAAKAAGLFWNPSIDGYAPYPNDRLRSAEAWFDDNGWLGLSFMDAYRATHERRYVAFAQRALSFVAAKGWDRNGGGVWWNTDHPYHSGEALSANMLLATLLYATTGNRSDLRFATVLANWANSSDLRDAGARGIGMYGSGGAHSAAIDYIQAPLIYGQWLLSHVTGQPKYAQMAAGVASTIANTWGVRYDLAPLYDSIYMQWMMAYGTATGDTQYLQIAETNAAAAQQNATGTHGLWLNGWWGDPIKDPNTLPGMLRTMAATASLYAWIAVAVKQGSHPTNWAAVPVTVVRRSGLPARP